MNNTIFLTAKGLVHTTNFMHVIMLNVYFQFGSCVSYEGVCDQMVDDNN